MINLFSKSKQISIFDYDILQICKCKYYFKYVILSVALSARARFIFILINREVVVQFKKLFCVNIYKYQLIINILYRIQTFLQYIKLDRKHFGLYRYAHTYKFEERVFKKCICIKYMLYTINNYIFISSFVENLHLLI